MSTNAKLRLVCDGMGEQGSETSVRGRRLCELKREVAFSVRWHGGARE